MLTRSPRGPWVRLVLMVSAMGLFVVGYYWGNQYRYGGDDPPAIEGVLVRPALEVPDFELSDASGLPFTATDLKDRWTLLAFGELSDARGHLAVTRMIDVYNRLADQPEIRSQMQLALVAAARSPNLARDFSRLSPALRVLSGAADELDRLRALLGEDQVGTDATIYLFGTAGRLLVLFTANQPAASIAADLIAISERPPDSIADTPDE